MKNIKSESVNCILTDPPYKYLKNQKLEIDFDEKLFFEEAKRVLKKNGFVVMFGRGASFYRWNVMLLDLGFNFKEEIIWNKKQNSSPVLALNRMHETVSIFCKGVGKINTVKVNYIESRKYNFNGMVSDIKRLKTVLNNPKALDYILSYIEGGRIDFESNPRYSKYNTTIGTEALGERTTTAFVTINEGLKECSIIAELREHRSSIHPTQKPVRLLERLLNLTTQERDVVLDPFSGSCSTGQACINLNRNFIGFEIDKEYYDLSVQRISENNKQQRIF